VTALPAKLGAGRTVRELPGGIVSALAPENEGAPYDRKAAAYDRLIPSRIYSRLLWATDPDDYRAFAREAAATAVDSGGPLLEVAGGTAVFTAKPYRSAPVEAVLSDLSVGMLERARERIAAADGPGRVHLLQADANDLPFEDGQFAVVAAMGALHVFEDLPALLQSLWRQVARGGSLFLSGFVAETRVGSRYMRFLERAGELAPPQTQAELTETVGSALSSEPHVERKGSMAYVTVRTAS